MLSKMRGKKPSGAVSERGSGAALVQTAMNFPEQRLRAEWLLANPGAQEEKFEPWLHDGAGSGAVSERGSERGSGAGRRELMNSYNMQRLPPEPFVSKQGAACVCVCVRVCICVCVVRHVCLCGAACGRVRVWVCVMCLVQCGAMTW